MTIKNSMRQKQLKEFVDEDHKIMSVYYDLMESDISDKELEKGMRKLIEEDEYFFDPYVVLSDLLLTSKREDEATELINAAYTRAVMKISDKDGNWPKEMLWGFLENRHLMRAIDRYALLLWQLEEPKEALEIFRKLLRVNPGDNQGIRHNILAIRLGLNAYDWDKPFLAKRDGVVVGLDASKIGDWFTNNAKKFPEEFDWMFKTWEKEGMI